MIRHLITLIWNQRKQNGWIFAELALVLLAVFMITDGGYSKYTLYNEPLGYNIDRCWRLHLEEMESDNEGYTGEDERGAKCWERITELTRRLMNTGEVEAVGCSFYSCPYSREIRGRALNRQVRIASMLIRNLCTANWVMSVSLKFSAFMT